MQMGLMETFEVALKYTSKWLKFIIFVEALIGTLNCMLPGQATVDIPTWRRQWQLFLKTAYVFDLVTQ